VRSPWVFLSRSGFPPLACPSGFFFHFPFMFPSIPFIMDAASKSRTQSFSPVGLDEYHTARRAPSFFFICHPRDPFHSFRFLYFPALLCFPLASCSPPSSHLFSLPLYGKQPFLQFYTYWVLLVAPVSPAFSPPPVLLHAIPPLDSQPYRALDGLIRRLPRSYWTHAQKSSPPLLFFLRWTCTAGILYPLPDSINQSHPFFYYCSFISSF